MSFKKIPVDADIYSVATFNTMWDHGLIIPGEDGVGYWATEDSYDRDFSVEKPRPPWAVNVAWFNK